MKPTIRQRNHSSPLRPVVRHTDAGLVSETLVTYERSSQPNQQSTTEPSPTIVTLQTTEPSLTAEQREQLLAVVERHEVTKELSDLSKAALASDYLVPSLQSTSLQEYFHRLVAPGESVTAAILAHVASCDVGVVVRWATYRQVPLSVPNGVLTLTRPAVNTLATELGDQP